MRVQHENPPWHDNKKVLTESWLRSMAEKGGVVGPEEKPLAPGSCTLLEALLLEGSVHACPASDQFNLLCHSQARKTPS